LGIYAVGLIFWAVKISINLVPVQAQKVTVGLASHSPCVTDNSGTGTTTYGLTASDGRWAPRLCSGGVWHTKVYLYLWFVRWTKAQNYWVWIM